MGVGARGVGRRLSADDLRGDAGGDGEGTCGKNMLIRVLILMVSTSLLCKTRPEQRSGERALSCCSLRRLAVSDRSAAAGRFSRSPAQAGPSLALHEEPAFPAPEYLSTHHGAPATPSVRYAQHR